MVKGADHPVGPLVVLALLPRRPARAAPLLYLLTYLLTPRPPPLWIDHHRAGIGSRNEAGGAVAQGSWGTLWQTLRAGVAGALDRGRGRGAGQRVEAHRNRRQRRVLEDRRCRLRAAAAGGALRSEERRVGKE